MRFSLALSMTLLGLTGHAATAAVTLQDRQQAACYHDVQKLCGEFIPDTQKTEACMSTMKEKVSPGCRKFYD